MSRSYLQTPGTQLFKFAEMTNLIFYLPGVGHEKLVKLPPHVLVLSAGYDPTIGRSYRPGLNPVSLREYNIIARSNNKDLNLIPSYPKIILG